MKILPKLSKKLIALIVAASMFLLFTGTAFAATLAPSDGYAYFYFAASGLGVDEGFKDGYKINGGSINYIASNIIAHTERIDETLLKSGEVNTFTILTGNTAGVVDETISRGAAGTTCDEFSVTVSTLCLILPDGKIVYPSKILAYKPVDTTTALNAEGGYTVTEITGNARIGDDNLDYAYKIDIQFDLTNVTLSSVAKVLPNIKNVSLEIGAEPSRRNIVWYSTSENAGKVQLALKEDMTGDDFPSSAQTFSASASVTGLTGYTSYKATMTGLAENTEYVYRVGNDTDGWSDVYSFKTQGFDGSFSFLAVADPQLGQGNRYDDIQDEIKWWTDTLAQSQERFTETTFLACLGDQVAKTFVDGQFDAFFSPKELKSFALAVIPGNHDVGANYTPHYNMPNVSNLGVQSTMGAGSGDYYFTYGDALFMTINSISTAYDEHVQFLENTIEANPNAKWKIVMMHYGIFGGTEQGDTTEAIINLRNAMAPEFSRLGIDVVLNGHEHSYARSYMMNAFTPNTQSGGSSITDPDPSEVLYMTLSSASGTDYVKPKAEDTLPNIAKVVQEYIPNVSKVDITDTSFTINTYRTSDMAIVDTFTINRTAASAVKSVSVSPKNATVKTGDSQTFAATIYGYNNPSADVVWSVSGNESAATTISADGVLSVDVDETAQELTVTATSKDYSSKYAQVTVAVESNITSVNVGQGVTYALPTAIDNTSVTWTDAAGNTETKVDTAKLGYRLYTGTLADGSKVKYRYNVGEYKVLMQDDFEAYITDASTSHEMQINNQNIDGGKFYKAAYSNTKDGSPRLVKDGNITVAEFGPHDTGLGKLQWIPTDAAIGEAFKVSYRIKVNHFDLDTAVSSSGNYFFINKFGGIDSITLRAKASSAGVEATTLYCYSGSNQEKSLKNYVSWTEPDANNVISMTDYIDVEIEGNNVQYSASVNGDELANSIPWRQAGMSENGVATIRWAKRSADAVDTVTYADDLVYSKAIYVTDTLKNVSVTDTLIQGDAAAQTAEVVLNMSDETTKTFTVNYTADTATAGEKTAIGTIDGFDDTVTVTYTVNAATVISGMANNSDGKTQVILSNNITLEDGAKLFVAVYNPQGSSMSKAVSVALTEAQRAAGAQTITLSEDILTNATDLLVKAFVWTSKLIPQASVLEKIQ